MSGFTHESAHNRSIEWYTPPEIFEALDLVFDLDPCSPGPGKSFVPTRQHCTAEDDGLVSPWAGTVFINPPYGSQTATWLKKLSSHGDGIALVFARTDVGWFHQHGVQADLLCMIESRVRFFRGDTRTRGGSPGAGSMLLAFGQKSVDAVLRSGLGVCLAVVPCP
jgi:DNA N-6-adenine-methyltransferase Dam